MKKWDALSHKWRDYLGPLEPSPRQPMHDELEWALRLPSGDTAVAVLFTYEGHEWRNPFIEKLIL